MTFEAAETYLLGTINETVSRRVPVRLERMRLLLHELGDPHLRYATFHVGGTSGKGSTATMIAQALHASGKHVGLHTKPHISSVVERARIDGVPISRDAFGALLEDMMPALERTTRAVGRPSYYETLLGLAFEHFARESAEVAVIEVGLGGLLDGTNLIAPVVSTITNVGLDHTEVLGDTVEAIAADKVGIAKRGVPLVSDAQGSARRVIEDGCARAGAPFYSVADRTVVTVAKGARYGQSFMLRTPSAEYVLELPVLGAFQQRNAATAVTALELAPPSLQPSVGDIERAFAQLVIPGRMEFFPGHPSVIFDIAHNPDKAQSLAEALAAQFPQRRLTFVVAIDESKDAAGILECFFALPVSFVFTTFEAAGRTPHRPRRLESLAQSRGFFTRAITDPVEALSVARRSADASSVVVVTGSTFLVAGLRDWWLSNVSEATHR